MKENRHDKFKRLAEARVNHLYYTLHLIGNLSNRINYSYTSQEVNKIFNAIERQLEIVKIQFTAGRRVKFSFSLEPAKIEPIVKKTSPHKVSKTALVKKEIVKVKPSYAPSMRSCSVCKSNRMCTYYRGLWICKNDWRRRKMTFKVNNHIKKQNHEQI